MNILLFVMCVFVLPALVAWCLIEAMTGWTDDWMRRMWDKWRGRK